MIQEKGELMKEEMKQFVGEFFASFILGLMGLGVLVSVVIYETVFGLFEFGICFALIIAFVVTIFNPVSGAHFNPAVTFGMAIWGGFPKKMVLPYWLAQFTGWGAGAGVMYFLFRQDIAAYELANNIVRGTSESAVTAGMFYCSTENPLIGIVAECIMTGFLVFMIFIFTDERSTNRPSPERFPIIIGLLVGFLVAFGGALTGTALNPARDFGPRVFAWLAGWDGIAFSGNWLVYFVGPLLGAVLGGGIFQKLMTKLYK